MTKILTNREIRKRQTQLRKKEEKKTKRLVKHIKKQKYLDLVKKIKERDNYTCQICKKYLKDADPRALQMAHVISKENYPELMLDENNVLSLCFYNHKNAPISSHLDGFVFTEWFKEKFPDRYEYLINKLREMKIITNGKNNN